MDEIIIKGAKQNNLKNISVTLPRNKLIVFTGLSGSGKSTLAFDTIFAEGQRRYMESLSSYARMFLGQMEKPDVEQISGLSPAISIDQKTTVKNPRSTVGTVTEIYDYLRLLYARIGVPHCPVCGKEIKKMDVDTIVNKVLSYGEGSKIMVLSPVVRGRKGEYTKLLEDFKKSGFVRVKIDDKVLSLDEEIKLEKNIKHSISVVVDRIVIKEGIEKRLTSSIETALKQANGLVVISFNDKETLYSTKFACPDCDIAIEEIEPRLFSFNSPFGACPECKGLGYKTKLSKDLICPDDSKSIREGAFAVTGWNLDSGKMMQSIFEALAKRYKFSLDTPVKDLSKEVLDVIYYGNGGEKIEMNYNNYNFVGSITKSWEGLIPNLQRRYAETTSEYIKAEIEKFMVTEECDVCHGKRLKREALSVTVGGLNIIDLCDLSIEKHAKLIENLTLTKTEEIISKAIIKEIKERLKFLINVGLSYLTLSRSSGTLSGGEAQRIRLATQIGSGLTGVLYVLDEPSIGLHQRDNAKLIEALLRLRDLGNTVIVVEHDEDMIKSADYIVDIGVGAGECGGDIVACGTLEDIISCERSITGDYLSGRKKIEIPLERVSPDGRFLEIKGGRQNNLKNVNVKIPVGLFNVVTGVSGSGKSSLVNEIIAPVLLAKLNRAKKHFGNYDEMLGVEHFDKCILIDQSPIGRTPRSNPATYTKLFDAIRELFASTQGAKERGYKAGRFSFNTSGGRCENCKGDGIIKIEMHFLPDVFVPCEVCEGKRYNRETLQVKYKGKNISDVLEMTVDEAVEFFENIPSVYPKLKCLQDVGLGYIRLGQSATTLSGGEAQRVKLATELSKRSTGKTIYILDEPTTGLHSHDIAKLIEVLKKLQRSGNTLLIIEHNLDVIKVADYIIDLGKEGGDGGGEIIATGTPEQVAESKESYTGEFLKQILNK